LWEETLGAFDPASGALIQLWRNARLAGRIPEPAEIEEALTRSGMQRVLLDPQTQSVRYESRGVLLDFAAIGKGHAIDLAAEHLRHEEMDHFLIHGGQSSLRAYGQHAGHAGWPVGIKNPLFTGQRCATVLLCNQGMSTSGSNIQYFRHGGRRYGHLLDPRTGWPAEGLLSVTAIAPSAAAADALSTALYVMGLEPAQRFCDEHPEVGAILVPPPAGGRTLTPIARNIPVDRLFYENPG
jgi:thiamine biosynthesis lipoprotein